MSEKRGYPNPNYTEEDVLPGVPLEVNSELILSDELIEFIQKAAALDILSAAVKATGKVDDDLVRAITGTLTDEPMVPKKEADNYWGYYMNAKAEKDKLSKQVAELQQAKAELTEILRQNHVGPFAETAENPDSGSDDLDGQEVPE